MTQHTNKDCMYIASILQLDSCISWVTISCDITFVTIQIYIQICINLHLNTKQDLQQFQSDTNNSFNSLLLVGT